MIFTVKFLHQRDRNIIYILGTHYISIWWFAPFFVR